LTGRPRFCRFGSDHEHDSRPDRPACRRSATTAAWSLPARAISYFSGTVGLVIKIVLLSLVNALASGRRRPRAHDKWPAVVVLVLATIGIDAVYTLEGRRCR
jgi:hypothetical protein